MKKNPLLLVFIVSSLILEEIYHNELTQKGPGFLKWINHFFTMSFLIHPVLQIRLNSISTFARRLGSQKLWAWESLRELVNQAGFSFEESGRRFGERVTSILFKYPLKASASFNNVWKILRCFYIVVCWDGCGRHNFLWQLVSKTYRNMYVCVSSFSLNS